MPALPSCPGPGAAVAAIEATRDAEAPQTRSIDLALRRRPRDLFEAPHITRNLERGDPLLAPRDEGRRIARNVIRELTCRYGGVEVFRVEPSSGIAANPFFAFPVVARESGEMVFEWTDDAGARDTASVMVTVAG